MGSNMAGHCCSRRRPMLDALPPIGMLLLDPEANEAGLPWREEEAWSLAAKSMTTFEADSARLAACEPPRAGAIEGVAAAEEAAEDPPMAPSCCSAAMAAPDDSEDEEDDEEEEWEMPEVGDCGGDEELLGLWEDFFFSLVRSALMPGHSKWTQWNTWRKNKNMNKYPIQLCHFMATNLIRSVVSSDDLDVNHGPPGKVDRLPGFAILPRPVANDLPVPLVDTDLNKVGIGPFIAVPE